VGGYVAVIRRYLKSTETPPMKHHAHHLALFSIVAALAGNAQASHILVMSSSN
jgi:hypothetical protein